MGSRASRNASAGSGGTGQPPCQAASGPPSRSSRVPRADGPERRTGPRPRAGGPGPGALSGSTQWNTGGVLPWALAQGVDQFGRRHADRRMPLEHVEHVVRFVPAADEVLEVLRISPVEQVPKFRGPSGRHQLHEPARGRRQVVDLGECAANGDQNGVWALHQFVPAGVHRRQDAIDELRGIRRVGAQRISRQVRRRVRLNRDLVMSRVLLRPGTGELDVDDVPARERLLLISRHPPRRA